MSGHTEDWVGRASPSVADVQAFEALPVEVQELARRVLLHEQYPEEIVDIWLFDTEKRAERDAVRKLSESVPNDSTKGDK